VYKSKLILTQQQSQNISNNTFTNLNVNTTGAIIFISNNVVLSSAGTQDVNNNAIVGTFVLIAILPLERLLCLPVASSVSGSVTNNNNNNFRILR
jgi:hypothetical protein